MESKKIPLELVWKYIRGEEIANVEKLENNASFMLKVMEITKDKKMFRFCSKELQKDLSFIKDVVTIFKDEQDFIISLFEKCRDTLNADEVLHDVKYQELLITMCNLVDKENHYVESIDFHILKKVIYSVARVEIMKALLNMGIEEPDLQKECGAGFIFVTENYGFGSEIIINDYAKQFISDYFENYCTYTLEDLIHKHFASYEQLKKKGIKTFLIEHLMGYDKFLAKYLYFYPELLNEVEKDIESYGKRWNQYNECILAEKLQLHEEISNLLIEKHKASFTYSDILLEKNIMKYIPDEYLEIAKNQMISLDKKEFKINDFVCYNKILDYTRKLFSSRIIEEELKEEKQNDKISNFVVVDFKSRKKVKK